MPATPRTSARNAHRDATCERRFQAAGFSAVSCVRHVRELEVNGFWPCGFRACAAIFAAGRRNALRGIRHSINCRRRTPMTITCASIGDCRDTVRRRVWRCALAQPSAAAPMRSRCSRTCASSTAKAARCPGRPTCSVKGQDHRAHFRATHRDRARRARHGHRRQRPHADARAHRQPLAHHAGAADARRDDRLGRRLPHPRRRGRSHGHADARIHDRPRPRRTVVRSSSAPSTRGSSPGRASSRRARSSQLPAVMATFASISSCRASSAARRLAWRRWGPRW